MPFFETDAALVNFVINAKLPPWQSRLFKKNADAIQVHSQGQLFYKIDRLFPNEHPESKKHRVISFESITEASFGRAANNVNRIFKNSSYTVEASEKTIQTATQHEYKGQNFYNWFLDCWVKWALKEDANSLFVVYPPDYAKESHQPVDFIASEHIRQNKNGILLFISERESEVRYELEEVKCTTETFYDQAIEGFNSRVTSENTFTPKINATFVRTVYHMFIKGEGFYRIAQQENNKEYEIDFFPMKQAFIPAMDVGGEQGKQDVNKSFLYPFVPFGNLALLQHSQHTAVNFMYSFPRMSEVQGPCDAEGCTSGWILCEATAECPEGKKPCRACGGTGNRANQTPYKVYIRKDDPQAMVGDEKKMAIPQVEYYTPPTGILDYSKNEWNNYLEMAEKAVYIQQRIKTGNVEAAKSKEIDRDDLYSFLSRVSQVYFSRLRFALQCFENYYVGNPSQVVINIPYSFAILSEGEAFLALKDILVSSVPVMLKASQVESFINKFVSQSSPIRKFLDVLKMVDPLLFYSSEELTQYKVGGVITADQLSVHVFSYSVLQQMYFQDPQLFLNDNEVVVDALNKQLEKYKPVPAKGIKETFTPVP